MILEYNRTLFARNSSGGIIKWNIRITNNDLYAQLKISYGLYDGEKVNKTRTIKKGKNIGKANETTYLEQAVSEADSIVQKKIRSGYREIPYETIEDVEKELPKDRQDADGDWKPMLAIKFDAKRMTFPALLQPKLNGVRCEAKLITYEDGLFGTQRKVQLKSRNGIVYNVKHIEEELLNIFKFYPSMVFDGELYCHGMLLQDIVSAVKKPNSNTYKIQYHVYDIKGGVIQILRIQSYKTILEERLPNTHIVIPVDTRVVDSAADAYVISKGYISDGYEGGIVRDSHASYQHGKRTKYLQKIKQVLDKEFLLVDIIDSGNDTYEGQPIGMFVCKNDLNDLTFKVTPQATKKERYEYLLYKNQYIGREITVIYRERTKDKIPFHANGIIRDYE